MVIDELMDWDFPGPGFSGFTDEWQVRVDPSHIRAIRAFLAVIQQNPGLARPLIAALVVHLHLGGVFVADTDLFQRDVTALLNSDIEPAYHQIKHLLRIFPVYFNDIGAEGELREVSSRIDEIGARKDPLCHFLRKQCHVESNPRLIDFVDAIGEFWATGAREALRPYLSPPLFEHLDVESDEYRALHRVFSRFAGAEGVRGLAPLDRAELERRMAALGGVDPVAAEKSLLLVLLRQLLGRKYEFRHDDLLERIVDFRRFDDGQIDALRQALASNRHEQALGVLIGMLEQLKQIILSHERSEGVESIYRKRHIAAGIPSMYGRYREEKFEAMGLSFRIESLASALFDRTMSAEEIDYLSRDVLRKTLDWLRLLLRTVRVDGCRARGLAAGIGMLEETLITPSATVDQYVNVFQIISRSIEQLVRIRFIDVYQEALDRILRRAAAGEEAGEKGEPQEQVLKVSESLLRDLISASFGIQALDRLVARTLRSLVRAREVFDRETLCLLASFDAERCCVPIDARETPLDGVAFLGNKGYQIKRLARDGLPVPPGFILTTELFRCWSAVQSCDGLMRDPARPDPRADRPARARDRAALRAPAATAPALGSLGLRDQHARRAGYLPQRGHQRGDHRGSRSPLRQSLGRMGRLSALPAVLGHGPRYRPRPLRRADARSQGGARRREEGSDPGSGDEGGRPALSPLRPRARRGDRRRSERAARAMRAAGDPILGRGEGARLPSRAPDRGGVGHGRRRAEHGLRQPERAIRNRSRAHLRPAPPIGRRAALRRLHRAGTGR